MFDFILIITLLICYLEFVNGFSNMKLFNMNIRKSNQKMMMQVNEVKICNGRAKTLFNEIVVSTKKGISFHDITSDIQETIDSAGITEGSVSVCARHTTTAITINEMEERLIDDTRQFLFKLVPSAYPYLHNDIHLRSGPEDWPGGDEAWREQEPSNCHSHLISMLLGVSESIPVHEGKLQIGTWQSVILVELDGERDRKVSINVMGI